MMVGPLTKGKLPKEVLKKESTAKAADYLRASVKAMRDFSGLEKKSLLWNIA